MAKHARPRGPRPAHCPPARVIVPREPHRVGAHRSNAPTMLGVITNRADFEQLRREGCATHPAFADYLRAVEELLGALQRAGVEVRGRAFAPEDFHDYCERAGLAPEDGESHLAYTADPAAEEEWIRWDGEPVPEFLLRLERAHERARVRRQLDRMLCETAEAAPTGVFPEPLLRVAYARGAEALRGFLLGAGEGAFTAVCGLFTPEESVTAWADLRLEPRGVMRIEDEDLDLLCEVLCVGHALNLSGVVTLSGVCERRGEVGWEWAFDGESYHQVGRRAVDQAQAGRPLPPANAV